MGTNAVRAAIACSLDDQGRRERAARWQVLGARTAVESTRTDEGLRLTFRPEPGVARELRELAALERECCSFADWRVSETADGVVLDVGAEGAEAVAAVHGMFRGLMPGS
jgi:hypothetical protein